MDFFDREDLLFPESLPSFQRLFPDDAACAAYLEKSRWPDRFACPHCGVAGDPFRFKNQPGVLRCGPCRKNIGLTVGTVMERGHTPLSVWFWAAYLVSSQTPGLSALQFQRQLGLSRYETDSAFSTNSAQPWCVPARIVSAASSISTSRWMRPGWAVGRAARAAAGYDHHPIAQCGDPEVSEEFMPIVQLVFSNLKTWPNGIHHGVSQKHLQAYLNEFTFRFNRRFYLFNAFRSFLGMAGSATAPTAAGLYSGEWQRPTCCRYGR